MIISFEYLLFIRELKWALERTFVLLQKSKGGVTKALENLQNIKEKRFKEDLNSAYRMKEVCDLIPDLVDGLDL